MRSIFEIGNEENSTISEFSSNTTRLLTVEEVKGRLIHLSYIQSELRVTGIST